MQIDKDTPLSAFSGLETQEHLSSEQIERRTRELLAQLSLDEKLGMMDGDQPFWTGLADMLTGGYGGHPWVAGAIPRLGIPGIRFVDGPRGVVMKGATTFPVPMARGATWDTALEERVGEAIGRELRALGGNYFGGICINLLRHPAWGRAQETYGEDSFHVGAFGVALTNGVQQHVMACVKHFALNSMENARFRVNVTIDARALHEVYLAHFKRVVEAGVASVMSAYNSVNGAWAGQNAMLLNTILKEQWDFKGFVMTDFFFGLRDAQTAVLAGQDVEMPFQLHFHRHLKTLVENGQVPSERIDAAAFRILRQQVRFAQGRDPDAYMPDVVGCAEHRNLAREVAQKSIVLLKNEQQALPLVGVKRLAVIGRLADMPNTGDRGSSNTLPASVVTPLQGIKEGVEKEVVIDFADGSDLARAVEVARNADAVVLVVGYTHEDEGEYIVPDSIAQWEAVFPTPTPEEEPFAHRFMQALRSGSTSQGGDRTELTLPARDEALIQSIATVNPRTVVVMMAGSAVITENWRGQVPAIVMLWYPGMEGGHALADVLLGYTNPSGRLPCTFPARAEDLPWFDRNATEIRYDLWHGYRAYAQNGTFPAFPFGFGLSYTAFDYHDLRLAETRLRPGGRLEASVTITNTGTVAGADVVQLYIAVPGSRIERTPRELKAFTRITLAPGESRVVHFEVLITDLAYYDGEQGWIVEPTEYEVIIGRHALDTHALRTPFSVS